MESDAFNYPPFKPYVVDRVKNVIVHASEVGNELPTLGYLQAGLEDLYQKTRVFEYYLHKYENESGRRNLQGWGLDMLNLPSNGARLIPCYFHWFGTSMINYARLAGFLHGITSHAFDRSDLESTAGCEKIKTHCNNYIKGIRELEAVRYWRNKIAAHFAITDPKTTGRDPDNLALLNLSTVFPVGFSGGRFIVGQVGHSHLDKSGTAFSANLPPWSLTCVYEALTPRFFSDPMKGPCYTRFPGE